MKTIEAKWVRVTRAEPCSVCKKTDWCCRGELFDNCMRQESSRPCANGGWLHEREKNVIRPVTRIPVRPKPVTIDAPKLAADYSATVTRERLLRFAEKLGVKPAMLVRLGIGWSQQHQAFSFPMKDGAGKIIGIRLRDDSGRKWAITGSHAGLFFCPSKIERRVYVTEGESDTSAALSMGLYAIGRHSCTGGTEHLKVALKRLGTREVVIIADNDEPGINGAQRLAEQLDVASCILVPPAKDLREALALGMTADLLECMVKDLIWNIPQNKSGQPNGLDIRSRKNE